jgi:hypothetical protein
MSFRDALHGLFPSLAEAHTRKELFADGWLAYTREPPGEKRELKKYYRMYQRSRVSPAMIEGVYSYVTRWSQGRIHVYGFLMPSCREMVELERKYSGFEQGQFAAGFEQAGGIWIDVDPAAYESLDGSHLQRHAALQFSRDLAERLYELERHGPERMMAP